MRDRILVRDLRLWAHVGVLEHAAERLLDALEALYGAVGLELEIRKCRVPVAGFDGTVAVRRQRRWPA